MLSLLWPRLPITMLLVYHEFRFPYMQAACYARAGRIGGTSNWTVPLAGILPVKSRRRACDRAFIQGMTIDGGYFGLGEAIGVKTLLRDGLLLAVSVVLAVRANAPGAIRLLSRCRIGPEIAIASSNTANAHR